jgi:hypothetical protein
MRHHSIRQLDVSNPRLHISLATMNSTMSRVDLVSSLVCSASVPAHSSDSRGPGWGVAATLRRVSRVPEPKVTLNPFDGLATINNSRHALYCTLNNFPLFAAFILHCLYFLIRYVGLCYTYTCGSIPALWRANHAFCEPIEVHITLS